MLLGVLNHLPAQAAPRMAGRDAEGVDDQHLLRRGGVLPVDPGIKFILMLIEDDAGDRFARLLQHVEGAFGLRFGGRFPGGIDPQCPVGGAATGFGLVGQQFGVVTLNGVEIGCSGRTEHKGLLFN